MFNRDLNAGEDEVGAFLKLEGIRVSFIEFRELNTIFPNFRESER